ncbi:MAG TPA: nucleotidyltransferase domain-containing protein [Planctomycetota bacterium]|nr:nucleotidyltransferase domain-containing protein [Planctomycetota bacterium]
MAEVTDELLHGIVDAIVREVEPEQIVLFGSWARGNPHPDSDLDLLVVEREPFAVGHSRWDELRRVRRAISAYRVPKDILVYSSDEVDHWRTSRNHIIGHALRGGRVLYERH